MSGEDVKLHTKRVEKMCKNTRNEWRRCAKHSKRVEKMCKNTRNEWGRCAKTLETSGKDISSHPVFNRLDNFIDQGG
jgi:hypothetical protein